MLTRSQGRDLRRRYGHAKGSRRSIVPLSPNLGRSWTVLACMNYTGMVDWTIQELATKETSTMPKAVDRHLWWLMFQECVLPHLQRYCSKTHPPRSVLVIDNCSLHWFSKAQKNVLEEAVKKAGAKLMYIPQYEPRANAIEGGFSQVCPPASSLRLCCQLTPGASGRSTRTWRRTSGSQTAIRTRRLRQRCSASARSTRVSSAGSRRRMCTGGSKRNENTYCDPAARACRACGAQRQRGAAVCPSA